MDTRESIAAKRYSPLPQNRLTKPILTERERAALTAVTCGARNKEIARQQGVTKLTIKAISSYNKLGVDSRATAVFVGMRQRTIENYPSPSRTTNLPHPCMFKKQEYDNMWSR